MRSDNVYTLPPDLPVPEDDGACNHLADLAIPPVILPSTSGREVSLLEESAVRTIIYCYPRSGAPDRDPPSSWNAIPGARGCTPQSCAFRNEHAEFGKLGAQVFGLSTQSTEVQRELAKRVQLPFELLSDEQLAWTHALNLPTFTFDADVCIKRLTLILFRGRIEKVFYPVFPPDKNAGEVLEWLRGQLAAGAPR
jgi:peroxiredoxin